MNRRNQATHTLYIIAGIAFYSFQKEDRDREAEMMKVFTQVMDVLIHTVILKNNAHS